MCMYMYNTHIYRFSKGSKLSSIILVWPTMKLPISPYTPYKYIHCINTLDCCVEKFFVSQILHIYTLSISQFRFHSALFSVVLLLLLFFSFALQHDQIVWEHVHKTLIIWHTFFLLCPLTLSLPLVLLFEHTSVEIYVYIAVSRAYYPTSISVRLVFAF